MNKLEYLRTLENTLQTRLPRQEVNDIIRDYAEYFAEGARQGKTDDEIAANLGDPIEVARQVLAESQPAAPRAVSEKKEKSVWVKVLLILAGPIVRYIDLEEQLIAHPKPEAAQMRQGLQRFAVGLGKKVLLADAMGRLWSQMNADFTQAGALGAWVGLLAFSFQIFFDFAGYSDMAIGLGHMMGFTMPENFDRPYRARTLTEFWRRWHMTLTDWFKAYVYIPLGGSRRGRIRRDINVLVVWALTGLWHGAGWNFVLWGLYFAVLLVLEKRYLLNNPRWERIPAALRQTFTFLLVMGGWALFSGFGPELGAAMLGQYGLGTAGTLTVCAAFLPLLLICCGISFLPTPKRFPLRRFAAPLLIILCLAALAAQGYAPFVYFQF